jgi:5-methyltetrahydrofolate corrinoid/iron sulfur protein methyltransferase
MLLVSENIQITNPAIQAALEGRDPAPIQDMVRRCAEAGAEALDINPGPLTRNAEEKMAFLVKAVEAVTDLPLLIDTANPSAMAAALETASGKVVINGFSLEPARLERILPLAECHQTDIVGYLLQPDGHVPMDADGRLTQAVALYQAFLETGLDPGHLIIDPVMVPLAWENGTEQARAVLDVIRMLPDVFGHPVRTMAGLSNLTSGASGNARRLLTEGAYAAMLASAGLEMALLNVFHAETVRVIRACTLITRPGPFSWEQLP